MKSIVFDAGPVISMTMNNLVWILPHLRKQFQGSFLISETVKNELVDKPLQTKRFKFEALQTLRMINSKVLSVVPQAQTISLRSKLLELANNIYSAKDHPIAVVHFGEMESLAAALFMESSAIVVDERTTRKLLEDPLELKSILERKLHTPVEIDRQLLQQFQRVTKSLQPIRSFELAVIAFEMGLLDQYLPPGDHPKENLLDAVLWGLKLNGCAVSQEEITSIIVSEARR
jgi:predicted nucleic acid-binding protein